MVLVIRKSHIYVAIACCILLAAIPVLVKLAPRPEVTEVAGPVNWGLSFSEQGKPPVANASASELKKWNAYYIDPRGEKIIYLTFDAGYEAGYTPQILDTLAKHGVKAAFFLVGNYLSKNPELVKRMVNEGHIVANHTARHPDMAAIADKEAFQKELADLEKQFKEITGKDMPKYYRPPQGKYSKSNLQHAHELGYKTIFWSLAYVDWYQDKQPSRDQAMEKLVPRIHPGAVVLLHSTSKTNAEILDELLTKWKALGYRFGTLDELTKT